MVGISNQYLHQIWYDLGKGPEIPDKYQEYAQSWKDHHPSRKYILWNKKMGDQFMKKYYPKYYNDYENVKYPIMKVDILRYCVLSVYGGIYVDIDYKCVANLDEYINNVKLTIFINEAPSTLIRPISLKNVVCNSLLISESSYPGENSEFWEDLLKELFLRVRKYSHKNVYGYNVYYILKTTGPRFLKDFLNSYDQKNPDFMKKIHILPNNQFNYCNDCRCFPSSSLKLYSFHDYMCSWDTGSLLQLRKVVSCVTLQELILVILLIIILIYMAYIWYRQI